ncbi:MAG: Do family serine endopeptidase [Verrucomicrobiota bacterium]|nr:Do family serine endopeptidase [Verrucomicrobiota bacterium]
MKRTLFFGICSALFGGLVVLGGTRLLPLKADPSAPEVRVENSPVNRRAAPVTSYAAVIKKAAPSVVNISSTSIIHERAYPFFTDPFFQQFFGGQFPGGSRELTRKEESLGSGVIISPNGYILTANHVVAGAQKVRVSLANGKRYTAKIVGTDPPTDVAVLKIDATGLPAITLADSDKLQVGDVVLAIGEPFSLRGTVTMGIVSALGRHGLHFGGDEYDYEDFIQTDAAINPGNSGGALVDAEGRLVGINTAIVSSSGGNEGVGFAIPVNLARNVMERLIHGGKVTRGYLGILERDLTPSLAQDFHVSDESGALVDDVLPGTPAEKAGIEPGDVIIGVNGKKVTDADSLRLHVSELSPGSEATLKLLRNGHEKTVTVTLGELPEEAENGGSNKSGAQAQASTDALDGVTVSDLDADARQELHIPANIHGALVTDVDPDSNAARAGLRQGDVILQINHHPVENAQDAVNLCEQAQGDQILLWVWQRSGGLSGREWLSVDNRKEK